MEYHLYPLKLYFRKIPVVVLMSVGALLNVFSWVWLLLQVPRTAEQVFLHYTILFGVDQIGEPGQVYYVPLMGLALLILNFFGGWVLYRRGWFYSYTLLAIGVVVNMFVAISSVLVVFLNI
ncbi:MAG: hypothetical protein KBD29_03430 [Candidatus Magasanikbacteria bacterium]|nr:hypothetical protein [Candidatus Magasanikbacteria bacterium]